jgi:Flp pilus assembly protein TadD
MRKLIIAFLAVSIALAGSFGGCRYYKGWRQGHSLRLAKQFLSQGNFRSALISVRKALDTNPGDIEACRLMADFAELTRSPNAVFWRKRVVELEPGSILQRLALARVATAAGEFETASAALEGVPLERRTGLDFHKLSGALATARGRFEEAEGHFKEAMELEPANPVLRLNFAMLRARRADPSAAAEGHAMLEQLSTHPVARTDALRQLALDGLRRTNLVCAEAFTEELLRETNSIFTDRVLQLDVLRAARSPALGEALLSAQQSCGTNAARVYEIGRWMLLGTNPGDTLAWLRGLAPEISTNLPVTLVVADAHMGVSDWAGLENHLNDQFWADMEYLRLAYRARAVREQGHNDASNADWARALKSAEGRLDRLTMLQRLTVSWRWAAELEEVLRVVTKRFPAETDAAEALAGMLHSAGKTRALLILYAQRAKSEPKNLSVKNNLAALALLLEAPEHRPHDLAREAFEGQPTNAYYASTYAYSLFLQNRLREALEVLSGIHPERLENPDLSGYHGLILAAAGEKVRAKRYLDLSAKARLLPEEAKLFRRAGL